MNCSAGDLPAVVDASLGRIEFDTIEVTTDRPSPGFFAQLFGRGSVDVRATAAARAGVLGSAIGAAFISLALLVDTLISIRWTEKIQPYLQLFGIGLTGLVVSAPYWLSVMLNHGTGIFVIPVRMQYEESGSASILGKLQGNWFTYSALQQDGVYFWSIAILLGIGWLVSQRKLFLPFAFLASFSIPRENAWVTAFPAALLVAYGIADVLVPTIRSMSLSTMRARSGVMWGAFGLIGISMILQAGELVNFQMHDENWSLKTAQVGELRRAQKLIPPTAGVIVLGNGGLREWAPYLLQREVLNTEFGLEWQPAEYRQIILANQVFDDAESWENVAGALRSLTGQKQPAEALKAAQAEAERLLKPYK